MSHSNWANPSLAVVGIARLAEMTGTSLRALRYYEEIGLLRPFRTANRARLFTGHQCEMAAMIVSHGHTYEPMRARFVNVS